MAPLTGADGLPTCTGVDYTNAPVARSFPEEIIDPGFSRAGMWSYTIPQDGYGCYTYEATLKGVAIG